MKTFLPFKLASKGLWLLLPMVVVLFGCYPEGGEYVEDFDAVYTDYSTDYFSDGETYTYSLPDQVMDLDKSTEDDPVYIDPGYSSAVLSTVRQNLNALGWTETSANIAEVVIVSGAFDKTFISYNPWWWDWYYPWGPWSWWYPGYYPGYVSGYSSGSILVQMTYPADTTSDNEVPVIWLSVLNGLLQGSDANIESRITSGINDAFSHDPFNN